MAKRGKSARTAGNQYERDIANEFRSMGWADCVTSRSESKRMDDAGVDLMYTEPFNIQAKRWASNPNYSEVLNSMPQDNNYNVIFHKKPRQGDVVVMPIDHFNEVFGAYVCNVGELSCVVTVCHKQKLSYHTKLDGDVLIDVNRGLFAVKKEYFYNIICKLKKIKVY